MLMLIMLILMSSFIALLLSSVTHCLSKKSILDREMNSPFECGFSTKEESRFPFSLRFFLVALIFLIFDVELLMLFPYLSSLFFTSNFMNINIVLLFLWILSLGLFYEWNNSMLNWV